MVVSNSDRSSFKNCRRKWDLGSPNRQNLRVRKKQRPLWLGTLVHNCLEGFYGGWYKDTVEAFTEEVKKVTPNDKVIFAEEIELAEVMMQHYALVYPSVEVEPFTVLAVEMPFQIPLNDEGDIFAGTIDGVIRFKDGGNVGILEHKTFSLAKDARLHGIDDQTSIYPPALNTLIKQGQVPGTTPDDFCDTVLYNGLLKKVPSPIKVLQNGGISKKSFASTTPQWLEYSMNLLPVRPVFDLDITEELEHNVNKFFPRHLIYRGEQEQQLAVNRLLAEFEEMKREDAVLYHNPTTECAWKCPFIPLCEAMNSGADTESIIETLYEKAPSRGEAYE